MKFILALIAVFSISVANAQVSQTDAILNTPIGRLSLEYLAKAHAVNKIRSNCSVFIKQSDDMIQGWESEDDKVFFESSVVFSLAYVQEEVFRGMDQTASRYLNDLAFSRRDIPIQFFRPQDNRFMSGSKKDWCRSIGEETVNNILVDFRSVKGQDKSLFTRFTAAKAKYFESRDELSFLDRSRGQN